VMSRAACTVRTGSWPPEPLARIHETLASRGWHVEGAGDTLFAWEDPARLCCIESPAKVTVKLSAGELKIQALVPGWGPVSSRNARSRLEAVARLTQIAIRPS
jgi:hypothetical protein